MPTANTAAELFNVKVPSMLRSNPDKVAKIRAVYAFELTGPGGGTWTVDLISQPPTCMQGLHGTPNCVVTISYSDFKAMLLTPNLGMQLYFQGKLKVVGDANLVMRLKPLFDLIA